jgi:iron complex outermembrane receptor protein
MSSVDPNRNIRHFSPVRRAVIAACGLTAAALVAAPVHAQGQLEEIIVTATKRSEGVQDIPLAITVLGEQELADLNITDMADYIQMLSNVSYVSLGPGSGSIYIRGISSGGESGLGASPTVATYLDEQPVTAAGTYLNPHIYDIERIELLAGPQGTTFGANAQSGAIRIISNQPDPSAFSAGFSLDANQPKSGDFGYTGEGFVNIPFNDRTALRVVGYYKRDPGFIDNVAGTHTFSNANIRAGLTDPELIAIAEDITIDNNSIAEENFNEATTIGGRAALRVDLSDSWTATAGVIYQDLESKGVWDHDPSIGDLQVQRWMPDNANDTWTQLSLKVEGELFGGTLTGTFANLDRESNSNSDYSLYTDYYVSYGFVQPFYSCYVSYFGACEDPRGNLSNASTYDRQNFELRYLSNQESRFRWMLGAFYSDTKDSSDSDYHVLGLSEIPGAFVEGPDIYWTTNYRRTYEESAVFGEASFDITERLSASVSARSFSYDANLEGFSGTVFWPCGGWDPGHPENNYGEDCADADRTTSDTDQVYRASLEFQFNDDIMAYTTWGEGYRPGGLNRFCATRVPAGLPGQGEEVIGCAFRSDFLTSFEVGIKSTLLDGRMRINASVFWQEWEDFQFTRLDTSISPITLTFNVGNAESNGVEADFQILLTDNWDLNGAIALVKAELTSDYSRNPANPVPDAPAGTPLPRVPEVKWNLTSRYNFSDSGFYLQGAYVYTGESFNTLYDGGSLQNRRVEQPSYQILNGAVGLARDSWVAELYVRNMTDERGAVWINAVTWDGRQMANRPRTVGLSYSMSF